jgi:hypothetical protein
LNRSYHRGVTWGEGVFKGAKKNQNFSSNSKINSLKISYDL